MKRHFILSIGLACFMGFPAVSHSWTYKIKDIGLLYGFNRVSPGTYFHAFDLHYEHQYNTCMYRPVLPRIYKSVGLQYAFNPVLKSSSYGLRLSVSPYMIRPDKHSSVYCLLSLKTNYLNSGHYFLQPEIGIYGLYYNSGPVMPKFFFNYGYQFPLRGNETKMSSRPCLSFQAGFGYKIK